MRTYAIINRATNTVAFIQGYGDNATVETSSDAYVVEVTEVQCQEGDIYDPETQLFTESEPTT